MEQNLHEQLQLVSHQIQDAQQTVIDSQGSNAQQLENALDQLQQVEKQLQLAKDQAGTEATENPQFQQAYEQLHNIRQQIAEMKQDDNEF
ncbi:histone-lysine N-methyltransferase MLL2 [Salirhabdus euzebyi]|uniref:Histone-lysine N-methyltransferase MLL2 n=1 Tax=Salirhabdus euzebyi TaxID=394506 RepID=A0A841PXF8_9BACI|nr:hypothetical protein [Salirhabdus euzebyi]MBB6452714.1 histone-lysine N-methyltransferase MLL2 [Salirhabdus euzebyi]